MSNLSVRTETKEYGRGDKGIFASDMNYLLSNASNSINYIAQNAIRLDADIDKTWKIEKNGSSGVLIRLGFIWRNGNFCRMTDDYTATLSAKVNDELNYVHIFDTNNPVEKPEEEGTIPHGGLTSSSSIWYVAALSSDEGDTNIDKLADWFQATHTTTQSILPNRYHILQVTRDELQYLYSGLDTHIDSCLYPIGCANFTGASEGVTGKLINISNTFLKQSINEKRELFPWDLMHYDRKTAELYINIGNIVIDGVRYDAGDWATTSSLFPYNICSVVSLSDDINYVYVEADLSSIIPTFLFKSTATLANIVDEPSIYRRLLYTIKIDASDYCRVLEKTRHVSEDLIIGTGGDSILPFTFREKDNYLNVYLRDTTKSYILNGQPLYSHVDTLGANVDNNWWRVASVDSPTYGTPITVYIYLRKKTTSSGFDISNDEGSAWDLSIATTDDAYESAIPLCNITKNLDGSCTFEYHRKGIINLENGFPDTTQNLICGANDTILQNSIERKGSYYNGVLQLYGIDNPQAPTQAFEDVMFVLRDKNDTTTLTSIRYITGQDLIDAIASGTDCEDCFNDHFWIWFCDQIENHSNEESDPPPWQCLIDFIGDNSANAHAELTDLVAGTGTDDHVDAVRDTTLGRGTNVSYLNLDGNALRNSFSIDALLGDSSGIDSISPGRRYLLDTTIMVDWFSGLLQDHATGTNNNLCLDWLNGFLYDVNGSFAQVEWHDGKMFDASAKWSVFWNDRQLYASDGSTLSLDWANRELYGSNAKLTLDYDGCYLNNLSETTTLNWNDCILYDGSYQSVDWRNRALYGSNGSTIVLDWSVASTLSMSDGTSITTTNGDINLNAASGQIVNTNAALQTLSLVDTSRYISLDPNQRTLNDTSEATVVDWDDGNFNIPSDSKTLTLGASADMSLSYNGSAAKIETGLISASDLQIDCGANKTILLTEVVYQDIDFPIIIRTTGAGIPTLEIINGNLTLPQWQVNDFNMSESQEFIHAWKEGTEVSWHIHYTTNGLDASDRYVKFELEYGYTVAGVWTFPSLLTTADILIPANTANKTMMIMPLGSFTPTGSHIGDHCVARLKRVAASGTAPSGNPWIPMLQMHVRCDTIGSRQIGSK